MAQFQRFLSYLFEYTGGSKGRNVGFARMEVRGEVQRIQLHLRLASGSGQQTPSAQLMYIAGFYREGGRCFLVPLGQMVMKNGTGQFQYVNTGVYLNGSQIPFSNLAGLTVSGQGVLGSAYATVWDDEPFSLALFAEEPVSPEMPEAPKPQEEPVSPEMPETPKPQEEPILPEMPEAPKPQEKPILPEMPEAPKPQEEPVLPERPEAPKPLEEPAALETAASLELAGTEAAAFRREEQEQLEVQGRASAGGGQQDCYSGSSYDRKELGGALNSRGRREFGCRRRYFNADREMMRNQMFWMNLCQHYPVIETLPGDQIQCLKAMPADIGRLPRANWILGNNGFLMYGYVKYRYIAFARIDEEHYEVWVPGTYDGNDRLMAEMFGFLSFRSMKSHEPAEGDFGYWCVPMVMPE